MTFELFSDNRAEKRQGQRHQITSSSNSARGDGRSSPGRWGVADQMGEAETSSRGVSSTELLAPEHRT